MAPLSHYNIVDVWLDTWSAKRYFHKKASKRSYTIANMTHGKYLAIHIQVVSNHVMLDNITLVRIETILRCESCQAMGHIIAFAICLMINALLCMPHSNLKVLGF